MPRFKYNGPDAELGKLGKVGCGSILELDGNQVEEIGGELLETWTTKDPVNILPYGSVPYVLDTTGMNAQEKEKAEADLKAKQAKATPGAPAPKLTPAEEKAKKRADELAAQEKANLAKAKPAEGKPAAPK